MTKPIVVAVTADDAAHDAVALGAQLAALLHEPLVLAAVAVTPATVGPRVVPGWSPAYPDADALLTAARSTAAGHCAEVSADVPCSVDATLAPTVVDGLDRLAAQHAAAAIVLGASHLGAAARALRGDIALGLLRHATCPVVTVPDRPRAATGTAPPTFGVAWDDSPEAAEALAVATDLAERAGATLRILHVVGSPADPSARAMDADAVVAEQAGARERARSAIEDALAATLHRVSAVPVVVTGPVGPELERLSEELDLLVLGSRRRGPLRRLSLGSTSEAAVHRAHCPLLVVPRGVAGATWRTPEVTR